MQLGGASNKSPSITIDAIAAEEAAEDSIDAWGGDLMDVHADTDDWSMLFFILFLQSRITDSRNS